MDFPTLLLAAKRQTGDNREVLDAACQHLVGEMDLSLAGIVDFRPGDALRVLGIAGTKSDFLNDLPPSVVADPFLCFAFSECAAGKFVEIADLTADVRCLALADAARRHGVRSVLLIPLRDGPEQVGTLAAFADEPHFFTQESIARVTGMVSIDHPLAVPFLVRRIKAQRFNRYYQALGELGRLIARSRNVAQLMDGACALISEHTKVALTYVVTIDSETGKARLAGAEGPARGYIENLPISIDSGEPAGMGITGQVYRRGQALVVNDMIANPAFAAQAISLARWSLSAAIGIPIWVEGNCDAVLVLASSQRWFFSNELVDLVEKMAQALGSAIEHVRERELSARYQAFYSSLAGLNEFIARDPDPELLYQETCQVVAGMSPELCAFLVTIDTDAGDIRIPAWAGTYLKDPDVQSLADLLAATPMDLASGHGLSYRAFRERETVYVPDLRQETGRPLTGEAVLALGITSLVAIPLTRGNDSLGAIVLGAQEPHYFTAEMLRLAERLAVNVGQALLSYHHRQTLEYQALTDALTGLPNRNLYMDRLDAAIAQAKRDGGQVALAVIDLDEFKEINDRLGHSFGDEVIRTLAKRLSSHIRKIDTIARFGGDELVAILPMTKDETGLENTFDRLLQVLSEPITLPGIRETISVSASMGVSLYPTDATNGEDLLRRADLSMYRMKAEGGNGWRLFEEATEQELVERHQLRREFLEALVGDEIVFHYQPKVDLTTGRVFGAEALARWQHPRRGLLFPGAWIDVVERNADLSIELGRYALNKVVEQLSQWQRQGMDLVVSLNIGAKHLMAPRFLDDLKQALEKAPQVAQALGIEVTETVVIEDFERLSDVLGRCRQMGVRIALDDFGTGYASLAYLQRLPADVVKVDIDFVRHMLEDIRAFSIVSGTLQISQMSNMIVLAEGVETEEHGLRLAQMGCQYAQGFAIAKALPPADFLSFVGNWQQPKSWSQAAKRPISLDMLQLLATVVHHRSVGDRLGITDAPAGSDAAKIIVEELDQCPLKSWMRRYGQMRASPLARDYVELHDQLHGLESQWLEQTSDTKRTPRNLQKELWRTRKALEDGINKQITN